MPPLYWRLPLLLCQPLPRHSSNDGNEEFYLVTQFDHHNSFRVGVSENPIGGCTGVLEVNLITPDANIEVVRNQNFTLQVNATCVGGCCGNVNVTADPKAPHLADVNVPVQEENKSFMEFIWQLLRDLNLYIFGER